MPYSARPPRTVLERCVVLERMRKMFERGRDIREAKKTELLAKERRKGREEGRAEGRAQGRAEALAEVTDRLKVLLESRGVVLPPEVADAIFGGAARNGS